MPVWSEVLAELAGQQPPNFDEVRRKYLHELHRHTKRNTILYCSGWLQSESPAILVSIGDEDIQALMEVTHGLEGTSLDLILHSPGGSPEAAEAIVSYLRSRFSHIRVIVPQLAMSAATMIACASDEIVLGKHSFLGPIDPQLVIQTPLGARAVPAQAVLDQFDRAKQECRNRPDELSAWIPMLSQFGPDLLEQCESALRMSRELVTAWLKRYMFNELPDGAEQAETISSWLADHQNFMSHSRHIPREDVEAHGLTTSRLENDEHLQDLALTVFHATTLTFSGTPAVKIVENHRGNAFIKQHIVQPVPPIQVGVLPTTPPENPSHS